jgi:rare lipoprotein A
MAWMKRKSNHHRFGTKMRLRCSNRTPNIEPVSGQLTKLGYLSAIMNWCRGLVVFLAGLTLVSCAAPPPNSRIKNAPYTIRGIQYFPYSVERAQSFDEVGEASWYGPDGWRIFGGSETTANGEEATSRSMSAAHKLLPLPSTVEVTNLSNGRRAVLRVNDRGPFIGERMLDVTSRAAEVLGFKEQGLTDVRVRVLRVGD